MKTLYQPKVTFEALLKGINHMTVTKESIK